MPPSPGPKIPERYADDYAAAQTAVRTGLIIKIAAVVVAAGITLFSGFILCLAIVTAVENPSLPTSLLFGIAGICSGIVAGIALYAIGVLVSTAGQILAATLDTAVHTTALEADSRVIAFRPTVVRERGGAGP